MKVVGSAVSWDSQWAAWKVDEMEKQLVVWMEFEKVLYWAA